jgi:hypothetical protein
LQATVPDLSDRFGSSPGDLRTRPASTGLPPAVFWKIKSGTDVMILKIFSSKNLAKILAFLTRNKAKF